MERISPKIEIINHFDNLINRIDIDIDSSIEKYNDQKLGDIEILKSSAYNECFFGNFSNYFKVEFFDSIDSSKPNLNSWSESTKVVDYLKQIRMRTIEEMKNAQEETLEYYKLNLARFKSEETKELKSELFAEKFYFQVNFKQQKNILWAFNVFTFVTDFYLSQSYIDSLEKLINEEKEPFGENFIFDDKMVLTGLLYKCFIDNLLNFRNHVIHVSKQDVLNIRSIKFLYEYITVNLTSSSTIDLSNLVDLNIIARKFKFWNNSIEYKIEGLSSLKRLHLEANTVEVGLSIENLPSLTNFFLSFYGSINEDMLTRLFDQVPYIQELHLGGQFSYFNLDNLVNLRVISLNGIKDKNFNFELFKYLCNQLEDIRISIFKIEEEKFFKLFDDYKFPYLVNLTLESLDMKRLNKEFINRFQTLRQLNINRCGIEVIESDSFSNMQQLTSLNLSRNRIELIEKNAFSYLNNLQTLDLRFNGLTKFDRNFIGLGNSVKVNIEYNDFNTLTEF